MSVHLTWTNTDEGKYTLLAGVLTRPVGKVTKTGSGLYYAIELDLPDQKPVTNRTDTLEEAQAYLEAQVKDWFKASTLKPKKEDTMAVVNTDAFGVPGKEPTEKVLDFNVNTNPNLNKLVHNNPEGGDPINYAEAPQASNSSTEWAPENKDKPQGEVAPTAGNANTSTNEAVKTATREADKEQLKEAGRVEEVAPTDTAKKK